MFLTNSENPFFVQKTNPITRDKNDEFSHRKFRQFVEESLNKVPISKKIFKSRKVFRNHKDVLNFFSN